MSPPGSNAGGMKTRRHVTRAVLCLALLAAALTACADQQTATKPAHTGTPTPAVCQHLDALRASMKKLQEVKIGENALAALSAELNTMQSELKQLPASASSQYSTEVKAVKTAAAALDSSIKAATTSPSPAAIAAVGDDVGALGAAMRTLSDAVGDTC